MKVSCTMFLGFLAGHISTSSGMVAPMAKITRVSSSWLMSAGSEYTASLPGAPFPDGKVFDPLGFSDGADPAEIKRWREAEIKHGRVAMLATVGVVVAESFHPLFMGPDYIGPAVDHFQEITNKYPQFWVAALTLVAFIEYNQIQIAFAEPDPITGEGDLKEDYEPGNLGFDPASLKPRNEKELKKMKTRELNNGRLAMIGIAGMLVQELVDSKTIFG